jgi:hypothetical protein
VAAPAHRSTFSLRALVLSATAVVLLSTGASSAMAQAPAASGPGAPSIADGTAQRALDAARQRWQAAGVGDYHFTVERVCFCAPAFRGPETIVVRAGVPLAPPAAFENVATVPRLHAIVQKAIDDRVERLAVSYDALGVPLSISIDRRVAIADDEITYNVSAFTVGSACISRSCVLVTYHRTGGFVAHDDRLSVGRDGRVIVTGRDGGSDVFFLSSADLAELVKVLEAANFPSLKPLYKPPFVISDGFEYTLTYRNETVVVLEGGTPPELEAPIALLDGLLGGQSS